MFRCPWKEKDIGFCVEGLEAFNGELITCRYWKKGTGCTYDKRQVKDE